MYVVFHINVVKIYILVKQERDLTNTSTIIDLGQNLVKSFQITKQYIMNHNDRINRLDDMLINSIHDVPNMKTAISYHSTN